MNPGYGVILLSWRNGHGLPPAASLSLASGLRLLQGGCERHHQHEPWRLPALISG